MPIYEYACADCGTKFEKFVRTTDAQAEIYCPKCGSAKTEKAFSSFCCGSSGSKQGSAPAASSCGPTGG